MTPEQMAEALERARYAQLRGDTWMQLREGERATRTRVCLEAMRAAGIVDHLLSLQDGAQRTPELDAYVAQRDAEIARLRREHDAELTDVTSRATALAAALTAAQRTAAIAVSDVDFLGAQVVAQGAELDAARSRIRELEEDLAAARADHHAA